ncbi:hypothetical protein Hden_1211 [Hyphomicrobium denitrificans ATCC 51888]|uniref:Uncharacterized protein n=2 Tax=Hyphomicrobium denitrificans TaxID=53399 RepID=D8JWB0_HYPDA|nr:hypothetical protein Hden_1211 [Hyphomicrobium denitrificans ATCC 51888]
MAVVDIRGAMKHGLVDIAVKQISDEILARLRSKFPGDKARFNEIRETIADLCKEFGHPGAVSVREENGRAIFVMTDPVKLLLMAAKMKSEKP